MQTVCNTYWDVAQNTRKPFSGRLCPGPRWGSLQLSRKPPSWWGWAGCSLPKNPIPAVGTLGLASPTPTPKLVPTPLSTGQRKTCKFPLTSANHVNLCHCRWSSPSSLRSSTSLVLSISRPDVDHSYEYARITHHNVGLPKAYFIVFCIVRIVMRILSAARRKLALRARKPRLICGSDFDRNPNPGYGSLLIPELPCWKLRFLW